MPLASVSVSSTKPDADQPEQEALERQQRRHRRRAAGRAGARCSRLSRPISTSACSAATMNSAYATSATAMCSAAQGSSAYGKPVRIGEQRRQQRRDRRDRQHDRCDRRAACASEPEPTRPARPAPRRPTARWRGSGRARRRGEHRAGTSTRVQASATGEQPSRDRAAAPALARAGACASCRHSSQRGGQRTAAATARWSKIIGFRLRRVADAVAVYISAGAVAGRAAVAIRIPMLDNLTQRLGRVVKTLRGEARLTEANIQEALREVRLALLEADVALPVVKDFIAAVREKALGEEVVGIADARPGAGRRRPARACRADGRRGGAARSRRRSRRR